MQKRITEEKLKKLRRISLNLKAFQIQKNFKVFQNKFDVTVSALLRSRNCLLLYHKTASNLSKKFEYEPKIYNSISESFSSKLVYFQFSKFFFVVSLIQKEFRNYLSRKQKRFEKFVKIWEKVCENFMMKKKSKKSQKKKVSKALKIPPSIRDNIFKEYYHSCLLKFKSYHKIQVSNDSSNPQILEKKGFSSVKNSSSLLFNPTNEDLKNLIRKALKINKVIK